MFPNRQLIISAFAVQYSQRTVAH